MVDNTPTKMVTRSIPCSDPDVHTVSTFDLGISQIEEEDALRSEEVRGIGYKRKVTDDVPSLDNDDDELVKETKKVVTQKTVPRRTLPKQPPILQKRKFIVKPPVKPKPSNVPTNVRSSSKSDEESILAKQFVIFQESAEISDLSKFITGNFKTVIEAIKSIKIVEKGPNVEAEADIPTVPQSSPQDINVAHFSVPNQPDTSTGHNVEDVEDIPVISQLSSQHIGTGHSSTPKQSDTCSVELQQEMCDAYISPSYFVVESDDDIQFNEVPKKKECHPKYKNRDESDPFEMIFVNDIPQQRSGSMDYGIYVDAYAEFLTGGQGVPNQEFDIALLRTR
ncbi:hypothetical protein T459_02129 [Capsicum annuum]|uniref:Uncharacterized protein n=1 Tax=Capsicum annuum TaxID=4072 RepID=A0A2G3AJ26_CAPAN|nr:hypothetical protein T459_02129 [Capsicum annuum]